MVDQGFKVHGAIWALEEPLDLLFQQLEGSRARLRSIRVDRGPVSTIEVGRPVLTHKHLSSKMRLLMWQDPNSALLYLLGCQSRDDFEFATESVRTYLAPSVSAVHYRTRSVLGILDTMEKEWGASGTNITEYTSRTLTDDGGVVKQVETERHWAKGALTIAEVFERLAANRQWLFSTAFSTRGADGRTKMRLLRNGTFTCTDNFGVFVETVMPALRSTAIEIKGFFDARDRQTSPTGMVRPVQIEYPHDVFGDKRANSRLLRVLDGFPNSAIAVYHPNPYLHASLIDYTDGSSFEIWVTTSNAVLLVPRVKASPDSLQRLCNHICDDFEEGDLVEFTASS